MDLNSIKLEDKKQEIQIKKRQLELNMLEEQVNRLKRLEGLARQELASVELGEEAQPEVKIANRSASANGKRQDQNNEEEQDKKKIAQLLRQLDQNNEDIYQNKLEIRDFKE